MEELNINHILVSGGSQTYMSLEHPRQADPQTAQVSGCLPRSRKDCNGVGVVVEMKIFSK